MRFIVTLIGTFFYTGFFPFAPATFASLVYCAAYVLLPGGEVLAHPLAAVAVLIISVPVATRLEKTHGHDASCIVIDEIVGMQMILAFAQPTRQGVVIAFFLFRLFDIVKPAPARQSQDLPGGWGVVADDVIAGLYGRIGMIVLARFFEGVGTFY